MKKDEDGGGGGGGGEDPSDAYKAISNVDCSSLHDHCNSAQLVSLSSSFMTILL